MFNYSENLVRPLTSAPPNQTPLQRPVETGPSRVTPTFNKVNPIFFEDPLKVGAIPPQQPQRINLDNTLYRPNISRPIQSGPTLVQQPGPQRPAISKPNRPEQPNPLLFYGGTSTLLQKLLQGAQG